MYVSDTLKLTATASDEEAVFEWTSSDESIATVRRGTVTAKKEGTATITVTSDSGATATCSITVLERILTISKTSAEIDMSESTTLTLTATSNVEGDKIVWSTSNPSVATVSGGVVTAVDVGQASIIASVGSVEAVCTVTVTDPNRPEDYRKLEYAVNTEVCANPGVWYYQADGSSYGFTTGGAPVYQNGGVEATIAQFTSGDGKYFRFRYQPGGADGSGLQVGDVYTITYTVTVNTDGNIGGSNGTQSMKANEPRTFTYTGTVSDSTPFQVTVQNTIDIPSGGLYIRVGDISIQKAEVEEYTGLGKLELGKIAQVKANPGFWYYHANGTVFAAEGEPAYSEDGILSVTATSWGSDAFYFRYQPGEKEGLTAEDEFTVTFVVETDFAVTIRWGYEGASNSQTVEIEANTPTTLTMTATVGSNGPFFVSVCKVDSEKFLGPDDAGTFTVSDISFQKVTSVEGEE